MASSTASGALSLLNTYGGNSNVVKAMVREQELNQAQAEEIATLRKQLAALKSSSSTETTTTDASAVNAQLMNQLAGGYAGMYGGTNSAAMYNPLMQGANGMGAMSGLYGAYGLNSLTGAGQNGNAIASLLSSGRPVTGAAMEAALQQNAKVLQQRLAEICQANGINTKQDVSLNLDSSGQIVVTSGSDKDKLQTALRADASFTQLFRDTKTMSEYIAKMKSAASTTSTSSAS